MTDIGGSQFIPSVGGGSGGSEGSGGTTGIGRVIVPPEVPAGFALFYTTTAIEGRLNAGVVEALMAFVRERFGVDAALATCNQIHSANIVHASVSAWREHASCDALWSDQPHTALGIKVADCLPVTIIDDAHGVIANVHSGWRGAVQRITDATLDALARDSAFDPATARAWLGPAIRVCCFEVGEEVVEQFRASYPNADAFVDRTRGPKPHIDTAALTKSVLEARGITRIVDVDICTKCDRGAAELRGFEVAQPGDPATPQPLFHSYRRDPKRGGRNLAIVARQ
jgi:YfiH family protein